MTRLLVILFLLGLFVMGAVVWSGGDAVNQRADFSFVNRGENKCLDPNGMSWMQDIRIAYALWEGLYALDPVTLKPIPGTAETIDLDPTHTVYTFHIRPTARWTNGDSVTANDFVFAWRRMLETPGEYTYLHLYIKGAKKYQDDFGAYADKPGSARPDFGSVGEKAIDARTFQVTLENPVPFFPSLCAFPPFFPLNEKSMRDFSQTDPQTHRTTYDRKFTRPPYLVTDGPFEMTEWSFKRRIRMRKSKYYWDRQHVQSETIDQIYGEDPLAAFRMYDRNEVDWLADVDSDLAASVLTRGGRNDLHIFTAFGTYFYSINCMPTLPGGRKNPFTDVRVRQALAMAIEKAPIVRDVGRLGQPIATTYIPPGVFPGYQNPPGLPLDIEKARQLLADAGYPQGRGFPRVSILYNTESLHGDVAQVIRRQWLTNLGIEVAMEGVEIKVFGKRLYTQDYDIARASWYGDYDDPSTFTDKYKSDADGNDAKWINADYDKLCAAAQLEPDPAKRLADLSKAESILLNEAPIIPIYHYVNAYMFRDNVKGIPLDPKAMLMFKSVKVER